MTPEDKYALKELFRGFGVFAAASAVFIIILIVLAYFASGDKPINSASFEVVDKYDNRCNVIRYTPNNSARYVYFLDCSSKY